MSERRFHVLVLGWDYNPLVSGGVGKASYELAEALSKYTHVTLVVPQGSALPSYLLNSKSTVKIDGEFPVSNVGEKVSVFEAIEFADGAMSIYPYPVQEDVYVLTKEKQREEEPLNKPDTLSDETSLPGVVLPSHLADQSTPQNAAPTSLTQNDLEIVKASEFIPKEDSTVEAWYGKGVLNRLQSYTDAIVDAVKNKPFDIIHAHDWVTYPAALKLKELTGKPLVVHVHSLETDRVPESSGDAIFQIEQRGMDGADYVLPVSDYTRNNITAHYGVSDEKIHSVHHGITPRYTVDNVPYQSTSQAKKAKVSEEKTVLFLGRLTWQKGPGFLIETAAKLIEKMPNVKFVIAGTGDKLRGTMQLAKAKGIITQTKFVGFLNPEEVKKTLAKTDVFFMPSVSEPFGLSALEAVQMNIPVVVSKQSGIPEVLPNVLQADFWETDRFANYLYALLNYNGVRKQSIESNNEAIKELEWDKAAKQVYQYYQALMNESTKESK